MAGRSRRENRGYFRQGFDPRRHALTLAEHRRGGLTCAKKYTVHGGWYPDWHERCSNQTKGAF